MPADLACGRFAMIDDGTGLQLVPYRLISKERVGQHIPGIALDSREIEWVYGRRRVWGSVGFE
ncbi:DUF3363 domain-containing protein [Mesorhizobium sp. STM 4661]|uniref:DUF3363 domain-containing protein n=1 Tax=Mesorhizobium sp. STM 4661 TaxID=1297570 RepID=UPI0002BDB230|nr:DUF3363 domain-containing protein [Mesorhizobium sp. STM 4661]CCV14399.1 hypothetical protein MESS4_670056 [Mesorhizobium sp. STM 4661]